MKEIQHGLTLTPPDPKNYKFVKVFGTADMSQIPDFFVVGSPLVIKDQKNTDRCTGYGSTAVSEDQEGVELNPEFQFYITKKIEGNDSWGASLTSVAKSLVNYGSLPQTCAAYNADTPREVILDDKSWKELDFFTAKQYAKGSFFEVGHSDMDTFDSIVSALWIGRNNKQSIMTGANWRSEWTYAPDGQIPKTYSGSGSGHCFKIFGRQGDDLICQLSNGRDIGDNGLFYMPREVANRELIYGNIYFSDLDKYEAKWRQYCPVWLARILGKIEKFIKNI